MNEANKRKEEVSDVRKRAADSYQRLSAVSETLARMLSLLNEYATEAPITPPPAELDHYQDALVRGFESNCEVDREDGCEITCHHMENVLHSIIIDLGQMRRLPYWVDQEAFHYRLTDDIKKLRELAALLEVRLNG
jgi:hypothetical protein